MKKLIDYLSSELKIANTVLLEKDILLHKLLGELWQDQFFASHFIFKGGTCVTKCYLGYYRFSEDLDFTWADQTLFTQKSQKEIRKLLSQRITLIAKTMVDIAEKFGLDFIAEKNNHRYMELGGSNKFSTFKLWYKSEILPAEQFIKIQINFMETFCYPFSTQRAKSIASAVEKKKFLFLFPDETELLALPEVRCYSLPEILLEKFRAVLTRRNIKARDFIDIFLIAEAQKIDPIDLREKILIKIRFMLRYDKYLQNLYHFELENFVLGEEEKLLLTPLPSGFPSFLKKTQEFVISLQEELQKSRRRDAN